MKRQIFFIVYVGVSCLFFSMSDAWALTPEQVIALKNAGVSDQTIQLMIRQEQDAALGNPADIPGRKEIRDKDGKDVIVYSAGGPAGNNKASQEKQTEKAWEMLNNIIIDTRGSKQPRPLRSSGSDR